MRQGFLRGSRYSPGNMDRGSREALFVGRHEVMDDVLSRITTSIRSSEKHFVLLVGPRGSGKTHFLALAYHRLLDRLDAASARDHRRGRPAQRGRVGRSHRTSTSWSES